MIMKTVVLTMLIGLLAGEVAFAQTAGDLTGRWRINGNGFPGDLAITQAANGTLSGTMYGNPITGYMARAARQSVILRGPPNAPDQVYFATLAPGGGTLSGIFYAFSTSSGGASNDRNIYSFRAQRGTSATPSSPGPTPSAGRTSAVATVAGQYKIDGNGHVGDLIISQGADGTLSGSVYTESIIGHFAAGTGTIAFLRMINGGPFQVFTGTANGSNPTRLSGTFHALNTAGGATPQRLQYVWTTGEAPRTPSPIVVGPFAAGDIVRATRSLDCDGLTARIFYGDTSTHVDVTRGVKAIRVIQAPVATPARGVRWECRSPGRTNVEAQFVGCPGMPATGGNTNVARLTRTESGATVLECVFRPGL